MCKFSYKKSKYNNCNEQVNAMYAIKSYENKDYGIGRTIYFDNNLLESGNPFIDAYAEKILNSSNLLSLGLLLLRGSIEIYLRTNDTIKAKRLLNLFITINTLEEEIRHELSTIYAQNNWIKKENKLDHFWKFYGEKNEVGARKSGTIKAKFIYKKNFEMETIPIHHTIVGKNIKDIGWQCKIYAGLKNSEGSEEEEIYSLLFLGLNLAYEFIENYEKENDKIVSSKLFSFFDTYKTITNSIRFEDNLRERLDELYESLEETKISDGRNEDWYMSEEDIFREGFDGDIDAWNHYNQ